MTTEEAMDRAAGSESGWWKLERFGDTVVAMTEDERGRLWCRGGGDASAAAHALVSAVERDNPYRGPSS